MANERSELKKKLVQELRQVLEQQAKLYERNMDEAQRDANEHGGAMISRYDTFKEEAQARRNGFAVQLQKVLDAMQALNKIQMSRSDEVTFGSVVETIESAKGTQLNFFIFSNMGTNALEVDNKEYIPMSMAAPIGKLLKGKKAGDKIIFRGKEMIVKCVE